MIRLISVGFIFVAFGCSEHSHSVEVPAPYAGLTNPLAGDSNAPGDGGFVFDENCTRCHGVAADGDSGFGEALSPPASDLTDSHLLDSGDDYLYYRISEGGAFSPFDSDMPAFKDELSEMERWQLVSYLRSLQMR